MQAFVTTFTLVFLLLSSGAVNEVKSVELKEFKRIDKKIGNFTKHMEESLFQISEKGLYAVEVLMLNQNLKVGRNAFTFAIHDRSDNDVSGAELVIVARKLESNIEAKPGMTYRRSGVYEVSNLVLTEAGHWKLMIGMKIGNDEDKVILDFPNVK